MNNNHICLRGAGLQAAVHAAVAVQQHTAAVGALQGQLAALRGEGASAAAALAAAHTTAHAAVARSSELAAAMEAQVGMCEVALLKRHWGHINVDDGRWAFRWATTLKLG